MFRNTSATCRNAPKRNLSFGTLVGLPGCSDGAVKLAALRKFPVMAEEVPSVGDGCVGAAEHERGLR
jgi:hypothetical protein